MVEKHTPQWAGIRKSFNHYGHTCWSESMCMFLEILAEHLMWALNLLWKKKQVFSFFAGRGSREGFSWVLSNLLKFFSISRQLWNKIIDETSWFLTKNQVLKQVWNTRKKIGFKILFVGENKAKISRFFFLII